MNGSSLQSEEALQHIPKYFRIQQELLNNIRSGRWQAGAAVPSEAELCEQYQVSRGTIRRALDELDRLGLIRRSPGRPTTVNVPKIPLLSSGFRTDIAKKGMQPGTRVLTISPGIAPADIADLLNISTGSTVTVIQRVILADNVPIIIESAHIARPSKPIAKEDVEAVSLLDLIPTRCQTFLTRAVESYEPILLSREEAKYLDTEANSLGIKDQAVLYDANNDPLYVSTAVVRGDMARIVTETSFNVHP